MSDHCEVSGARLPRPGRGESMRMDEAAAFRAGAEAMREAAAKRAECSCLIAPEVKRLWREEGHYAAWKACSHYDNCGAANAEAIRALPLPEPPASLTASGWSYRG